MSFSKQVVKDRVILEVIFKFTLFFGMFPAKTNSACIKYLSLIYISIYNIGNLVTVILQLIENNNTLLRNIIFALTILDSSFFVSRANFCSEIWKEFFETINKLDYYFRGHRSCKINLVRWWFQLTPFCCIFMLNRISTAAVKFKLSSGFDGYFIEASNVIIGTNCISRGLILGLFFHEMSMFIVRRCNYIIKKVQSFASEKNSRVLTFMKNDIQQMRHIYSAIITVSEKLNGNCGIHVLIFSCLFFLTVLHMVENCLLHSNFSFLVINIDFVLIYLVSTNISKLY